MNQQHVAETRSPPKSHIVDMDGVIVAGIESGMETVLVLAGVTMREDVSRFPYRPSRILPSVAEIQV